MTVTVRLYWSVIVIEPGVVVVVLVGAAVAGVVVGVDVSVVVVASVVVARVVVGVEVVVLEEQAVNSPVTKTRVIRIIAAFLNKAKNSLKKSTPRPFSLDEG